MQNPERVVLNEEEKNEIVKEFMAMQDFTEDGKIKPRDRQLPSKSRHTKPKTDKAKVKSRKKMAKKSKKANR